MIGADLFIKCAGRSHPEHMARIALLRPIQNAGFQGRLNQARTLYPVQAALVMPQQRTGLQMSGQGDRWNVSHEGIAYQLPARADIAYDACMPSPHLTIDFVSDISCPWCAVGLSALNLALAQVQPDITASVRFQPFELNPQMGPGGQDIGEHLTQKYGSSPEQQAQIRETIRQRGAAVGFTFHADGRGRIYNTFHAHRLLHWAGEEHPAQQAALKLALLQACHTDRQAMDDPEVLVAAVAAAGLDEAQAREILASDAFTQAVREREAMYLNAGVHAVPAVVINQRHLIAGGQPVEVYVKVIRDLAA